MKNEFMDMIKFEDVATPGTCGVCGNSCKVVLLESTLAQVNFNYCSKCASEKKEPYILLVATVAGDRRKFPEEWPEGSDELFKDLLSPTGKDWGVFCADIQRAKQDKLWLL
jgi:hypothetical protein